MPNYAVNEVIIHAKGKKLEEILNSIRRDGDVFGSIDFNKLIPMPESLNLAAGSITQHSVCAFISHIHAQGQAAIEQQTDELFTAMQITKGFLAGASYRMSEEEITKLAVRYDKTPEEFIALGKQYVDNMKEHGAAHWYEWASKHWGTKWNVVEGNHLTAPNTLRFETAWDAPHPILLALSKKFPKVSFEHAWANEDLGVGVGANVYLAGKITKQNLPRVESAKAYEMAADLWGYNLAEMNYRHDPKHDTYVYDESMEQEAPAAHPPLTEQIGSAEGRSTGSLLNSEQKEKGNEPQR